MKKLLLLVAITSFGVISVSAQDNKPQADTIDMNMIYSIGVQSWNFEDAGLNPIEMTGEFGFGITKWLSVMCRWDTSLGLFNLTDTGRDYYVSNTLGGVLDFKLISFKKYGYISLQTAIGGTIGNNTWKYTYYQGGVLYNYGTGIKPFIGIGVRYYDSNTTAFDSYTRAFISFGFRF